MLPSISNNSESLQEEKEHFVEGLWDMPIIEELAAFFFFFLMKPVSERIIFSWQQKGEKSWQLNSDIQLKMVSSMRQPSPGINTQDQLPEDHTRNH